MNYTHTHARTHTQPFYGPLGFVRDFPSEPTPKRYKKAVLSQTWPRDAPTKVNKQAEQPHLHAPKFTWFSVDSIQLDVMDVGVERTFSPQNFSMFPWKKVDDLWTTKKEDVGLIVRAISFQIFNLCGHDLPTSQTDRRTDRWYAGMGFGRLHPLPEPWR